MQTETLLQRQIREKKRHIPIDFPSTIHILHPIPTQDSALGMTDHINLGGIGSCQDLVDKVADFSGTRFQMVDGSKKGDAGLTTVGECKDAVPVLDQRGCDEGVPGFFGQ